MSESICLHIQGRESGPIRVVELPWISARIGRASYCEVRLSEHELADEACRLRKRGRSWYLERATLNCPVLLDGRPIDGPCLLPFDMPFQVGEYCLTLRRDRGAEPNWDMCRPPNLELLEEVDSLFDTGPSAIADTIASPPAPTLASLAAPVIPSAVDDGVRPEIPAGIADALETSAAPLGAPSVKDRWEARWRAAGAQIKAEASRARPSGEPRNGGFSGGYRAVPLKDTTTPSSSTSGLGGVDRLAARSRSARPASSLEPGWKAPTAEIPPRIAPSGGPRTSGVGREPKKGAFRVPDPIGPVPAPASVSPWKNAPVARPTPPFMEAEFRPRPPSVPPYASSVNHIEPLASEITPETDPEAPIEEISIDQAPLFELSIDAPPAIHEAAADSPVIESLTAADPVLETAQESFTIPSQLDTLPDPGPPGDLDDTVTTFQVEPRVEAPSQPRKTDPQPERRKRERNPGRPARVQSSKTHTAAGLVSRPGGPEASIAAASVTDRPKSRAVNPADDWPSAQDILSTCSGRKPRVVPRGPRRSRRGKPELVPTVENEPGQWKVPLWLVWPPLAIATLLVGGLTCYLSWAWVADSYAAMLIAERLAPVDPMARRTALPDSLAPPSGSWTRTTAQHLAHWALYLEGAQRGKDAPPPDIQGLLVTAVQVSPINATARLARARLESGRSEAAAASGLGLSRDPLSLALSGRQLLARGKRDRALALFAQALQIGSRTEFTKVGAPRFSGDPDIPRFLLPGEDRLREILGSLGDTNDWTADDWLAIVPTRTLVPIAAARLLRERGRKEVADALLDRMLAESTLGDGGGSGQALWLASRAEALALLARWQDADQVYRQAIELLDETDIQRSWWFNLADIDSHLPDSSRRQLALRATQTASNSDEISRRAGEMLRAVYARPGLRSNGTKAN